MFGKTELEMVFTQGNRKFASLLILNYIMVTSNVLTSPKDNVHARKDRGERGEALSLDSF